MQVTTDKYRQTAAREMADDYTQRFLKLLPVRLAERRKQAYADFADPALAQEKGAAIRAQALADLPWLLETFEKNARAAGARVFWAGDADAANRYMVDLARKNGISYVTKGKSMITEEIGLNEAFASAGIRAYETDLGEFITQLLERPPFHIVGPAINIPVSRISELFQEKGVTDGPEEDPVKLGMAARRFLRERFRHLEMGVTGVNLAVAETGTLINVENEGNIRLSKSSPRIQVAVMSIEKVVPDTEAALHLIRLLCRSCTGQAMSAYVSFDQGPKTDNALDGPEELHILILDNGRTRIYQNPETRDALRCIRCGACLNACPIYGKIGGYPYGWAYSGPMGQVLTPLLLGLENSRDLFDACTLCKRCTSICPVGIDHPRLLLYYRQQNAAGDPVLKGSGMALTENALYLSYAYIARHPHLWRMFAAGVQKTLNQYAGDGKIRRGPSGLNGWFSSRDLPEMTGGSFHSQWRRIRHQTKAPKPGREGEG